MFENLFPWRDARRMPKMIIDAPPQFADDADAAAPLDEQDITAPRSRPPRLGARRNGRALEGVQ
jgi:hypothetical protein